MTRGLPPSKTKQPHWVLRRADQAIVAALVAAGLAATVGWWVVQGGLRGRLVELERAELKTARFEVDLNSAEWPELVQLPSIGETLAKRIVDSRHKNGPFRDHNDLMRVRGIGPKTLAAVKPLRDGTILYRSRKCEETLGFWGFSVVLIPHLYSVE
jgi:competence protein ComEA